MLTMSRIEMTIKRTPFGSNFLPKNSACKANKLCNAANPFPTTKNLHAHNYLSTKT